MNSILKLTGLMAIAFTLASVPVQAQTVAGSQSQASNSNTITSTSQAAAQGGSLTYNVPSNSSQTVTTDGELRTAPSLGGLALGGGHPCAYSPATGQLSIVGGGAGFGGMQIDSACMLMVQAAAAGDRRAYNAAVYMIAARDDDACKAMYKAGMVADCTDKQGKSTVKAAPTVSTRNAPAPVSVGYSKCVKAAGNKVVIRYKGGVNKSVAKQQCLSSLGY